MDPSTVASTGRTSMRTPRSRASGSPATAGSRKSTRATVIARRSNSQTRSMRASLSRAPAWLNRPRVSVAPPAPRGGSAIPDMQLVGCIYRRDVQPSSCTEDTSIPTDLESDMSLDQHSYRTTFVVEATPEETFAAVNDVRGWWSEDLDG